CQSPRSRVSWFLETPPIISPLVQNWIFSNDQSSAILAAGGLIGKAGSLTSPVPGEAARIRTKRAKRPRRPQPKRSSVRSGRSDGGRGEAAARGSLAAVPASLAAVPAAGRPAGAPHEPAACWAGPLRCQRRAAGPRRARPRSLGCAAPGPCPPDRDPDRNLDDHRGP